MNSDIKKFILILMPWIIFAMQDNFIFSGEGKLRFRYVEADEDGLTGVYGEELKKGLSMRQRFDFSGDFFIAEYLTVGGTVRISNEDSKDILGVPDFVSTTPVAGWWYANLYNKPFDITVGSYETNFTPLTLMRWDQEDNPLGAAGCGCQVAVSGISSMRSIEIISGSLFLYKVLVQKVSCRLRHTISEIQKARQYDNI